MHVKPTDENDTLRDEFFTLMGMAATAVVIYKVGRFVGEVRSELRAKRRDRKNEN